MTKKERIFISCVWKEFDTPENESQHGFRSYMASMVEALDGLSLYELVAQRQKGVQGTGDLMETLDNDVHSATIIIHLVGSVGGSPIPQIPREEFLKKYPQLFTEQILKARRSALPALAEQYPSIFSKRDEADLLLNDPGTVTYTQWEYHLARHIGLSRFVFVASKKAPRSPDVPVEQKQLGRSQAMHFATLHALGEHTEQFDNQDDLIRRIFRTLIEKMARDQRQPHSSTLNAAKANLKSLIKRINSLIWRPERRTPDVYPGSPATLRYAIDTVAEDAKLTSIELMGLIADTRNDLSDEVAQQRNPVALVDLAYAQHSLGQYREALDNANDAMPLLEVAKTGSSGVDLGLIEAASKEAYNLLAGASFQVGQHEHALNMMEVSGGLISKAESPIYWAEHHMGLVEMLLQTGANKRALKLAVEVAQALQPYGEKEPILLAKADLHAGQAATALGRYKEGSDYVILAARMLQGGDRESRRLRCRSERALGYIQYEIGDLEQAYDVLQKALKDAQELHYEKSIELFEFHLSMGVVATYCQFFSEAQKQYDEALVIASRHFGKDSPATLMVRMDVAVNHMGQRNYNDAAMAFTELYSDASRSLGLVNEITLKCCLNAAVSLNLLGSYTEAILYAHKADQYYSMAFGEEHPDVLTCKLLYADLLLSTGQEPEEQEQLRMAVDLVTRVGLLPGRLTLHNALKLANRLVESSNAKVAHSMHRKALVFCASECRPGHPGVRLAVERFIELHETMSDAESPTASSILQEIAAGTVWETDLLFNPPSKDFEDTSTAPD